MYSLNCSYYTAEFKLIGDLIAHILISGMDPNYEVTYNGKPTGEMAVDLIGFQDQVTYIQTKIKTPMKTFKLIFAALLLLEAVCSFICLFDVYNTEGMIWFLLATFNVSSILSFLLIKSASAEQ